MAIAAIAVLLFGESEKMGGKVTSLEPQKRSSDRMNVYIDGEFAFGLAVALAMDLYVGTELSDEEIATLKLDDEVERARDKALNYLSYRPRSAREVRDYLAQKEISAAAIEETLERLRRVDLIDDEAFARYWVKNRLKFRPKGRRALSYELRQKGVDARTIDQSLADYDEAAAIEKAAASHARRLNHLPPDVFKRRLYGRLARRGFSYDLIRDILDTYTFPTSNSSSEESEAY